MDLKGFDMPRGCERVGGACCERRRGVVMVPFLQISFGESGDKISRCSDKRAGYHRTQSASPRPIRYSERLFYY